MAKSKKRNAAWLHFTPLSNDKARCDICKSELSVKGGSTSNMNKHLNRKHVSVVDVLPPKKTTSATVVCIYI